MESSRFNKLVAYRSCLIPNTEICSREGSKQFLQASINAKFSALHSPTPKYAIVKAPSVLLAPVKGVFEASPAEGEIAKAL